AVPSGLGPPSSRKSWEKLGIHVQQDRQISTDTVMRPCSPGCPGEGGGVSHPAAPEARPPRRRRGLFTILKLLRKLESFSVDIRFRLSTIPPHRGPGRRRLCGGGPEPCPWPAPARETPMSLHRLARFLRLTWISRVPSLAGDFVWGLFPRRRAAGLGLA